MNEKIQEIFFLILRHSIETEYNFEMKLNTDLSYKEWELLYKIIKNSKLVSIMYNKAMELYGDKMPKDIKEDWKSKTIYNTLRESSNYHSIDQVLDMAKKRSIEIIIFKGMVLADLYPTFSHRRSGDTDIYVFEEDKITALEILKELGYKKNYEKSKVTVPVFYNEKSGHKIELHYCLWEDFKGPKMEMLDKMNLITRDNTININVCNRHIKTINHNNHLIYQMFHIIKHFSTESVGIRYMADITLFINKYIEYIDIKDFWSKIKQLGYEQFCYMFFDLCCKNLNMNRRIMNIEDNISLLGEENLLNDMLVNGSEKADNKSYQILGLVTPYIQGEGIYKQSGFKRKLKIIFPGKNELPDKCNYAKKHPILLPIAWIHKFSGWTYRYIQFRLKNKSGVTMYNAKEKIDAADTRIQLMDEMGLLKKK